MTWGGRGCATSHNKGKATGGWGTSEGANRGENTTKSKSIARQARIKAAAMTRCASARAAELAGEERTVLRWLKTPVDRLR